MDLLQYLHNQQTMSVGWKPLDWMIYELISSSNFLWSPDNFKASLSG